MPDKKNMARPRTSVPELDRIVECWQLSKHRHSWNQGASDDEIDWTEESLELLLPKSLRAVYEMSDGISLVGGSLKIVPLENDDSNLSLANMSSKLREWNYVVPEELIMFGDNGSDSQFGIWLPDKESIVEDCPVIELCVSDSMAIAGTSLCSFLRGRTAYHLLGEDGVEKSLDALGLPIELRSAGLSNAFASITRWADPNIPDPEPSPYKRGLTADELRAYFHDLNP